MFAMRNEFKAFHIEMHLQFNSSIQRIQSMLFELLSAQGLSPPSREKVEAPNGTKNWIQYGIPIQVSSDETQLFEDSPTIWDDLEESHSFHGEEIRFDEYVFGDDTQTWEVLKNMDEPPIFDKYPEDEQMFQTTFAITHNLPIPTEPSPKVVLKGKGMKDNASMPQSATRQIGTFLNHSDVYYHNFVSGDPMKVNPIGRDSQPLHESNDIKNTANGPLEQSQLCSENKLQNCPDNNSYHVVLLAEVAPFLPPSIGSSPVIASHTFKETSKFSKSSVFEVQFILAKPQEHVGTFDFGKKQSSIHNLPIMSALQFKDLNVTNRREECLISILIGGYKRMKLKGFITGSLKGFMQEPNPALRQQRITLSSSNVSPHNFFSGHPIQVISIAYGSQLIKGCNEINNTITGSPERCQLQFATPLQNCPVMTKYHVEHIETSAHFKHGTPMTYKTFKETCNTSKSSASEDSFICVKMQENAEAFRFAEHHKRNGFQGSNLSIKTKPSFKPIREGLYVQTWRKEGLVSVLIGGYKRRKIKQINGDTNSKNSATLQFLSILTSSDILGHNLTDRHPLRVKSIGYESQLINESNDIKNTSDRSLEQYQFQKQTLPQNCSDYYQVMTISNAFRCNFSYNDPIGANSIGGDSQQLEESKGTKISMNKFLEQQQIQTEVQSQRCPDMILHMTRYTHFVQFQHHYLTIPRAKNLLKEVKNTEAIPTGRLLKTRKSPHQRRKPPEASNQRIRRPPEPRSNKRAYARGLLAIFRFITIWHPILLAYYYGIRDKPGLEQRIDDRGETTQRPTSSFRKVLGTETTSRYLANGYYHFFKWTRPPDEVKLFRNVSGTYDLEDKIVLLGGGPDESTATHPMKAEDPEHQSPPKSRTQSLARDQTSVLHPSRQTLAQRRRTSPHQSSPSKAQALHDFHTPRPA